MLSLRATMSNWDEKRGTAKRQPPWHSHKLCFSCVPRASLPSVRHPHQYSRRRPFLCASTYDVGRPTLPLDGYSPPPVRPPAPNLLLPPPPPPISNWRVLCGPIPIWITKRLVRTAMRCRLHKGCSLLVIRITVHPVHISFTVTDATEWHIGGIFWRVFMLNQKSNSRGRKMRHSHFIGYQNRYEENQVFEVILSNDGK